MKQNGSIRTVNLVTISSRQLPIEPKAKAHLGTKNHVITRRQGF
jgi:hypothetical protein